MFTLSSIYSQDMICNIIIIIIIIIHINHTHSIQVFRRLQEDIFARERPRREGRSPAERATNYPLRYNTALYTVYYMLYSILYHTIPYHTIPYHTIPYHTILYDNMSYCTILYYTILYGSRARGSDLLLLRLSRRRRQKGPS